MDTRKAPLIIQSNPTNESESSKAQVDSGLTHSETTPDSDKREQKDENNPVFSPRPYCCTIMACLSRNLVSSGEWSRVLLGCLLFSHCWSRTVAEKPVSVSANCSVFYWQGVSIGKALYFIVMGRYTFGTRRSNVNCRFSGNVVYVKKI